MCLDNISGGKETRIQLHTNSQLKEQAREILQAREMTLSIAIRLLYKNIISLQGLPEWISSDEPFAKDDSTIGVRINHDMKKEAEAIMLQAGITPTGLVRSYLKAIVENEGVPL